MSELKDYKVYTTRHEGAWGYHYEPNPNNDQSDIELNDEKVYLKKDADKVILHQKYKRCLAMAKWCESENYTACWYHENSERCKWTEKWHKRWLELAEKFKEAK